MCPGVKNRLKLLSAVLGSKWDQALLYPGTICVFSPQWDLEDLNPGRGQRQSYGDAQSPGAQKLYDASRLKL